MTSDNDTLEWYKEAVCNELPHFFRENAHLIDSVPEIRPIVLYSGLKHQVSDWTPFLAWQEAAEEIETMTTSKKRAQDHHRLFYRFYHNIRLNSLNKSEIQEFYPTYPLWAYIFTKLHGIYNYAAIGNALLPHSSCARIIPHIGLLRDKQQMRTLYAMYKTDQAICSQLETRPLMVELLIEEEGVTNELLRYAVLSCSVTILGRLQITFNQLDAKTLQSAKDGTYVTLFKNTLNKRELINNIAWNHLCSLSKISEELNRCIQTGLDYSPPTVIDKSSLYAYGETAIGLLNLLRLSPQTADILINHPSTRRLVLTSRVTYQDVHQKRDISLLLASYIVGRPLNSHYDYNPFALLLEFCCIDTLSREISIMEKIVKGHNWTAVELLDVLTRMPLNTKYQRVIIDELKRIHISAPYSTLYTPS